ncbi:unnamed protein product [Psylliodes chrysocephalus]|uniref:Uncharacterized protein n=1 Tax=Psylliodes chrysocephalus TaxID=3402493 RepID=A0A9P0G9I0_9CUCU|nr:unnamed protein product [Psylliodes chrysocephala]
MLNCVNTFDQHLPVTEQAGLVVAEEKTQHDSSGSEHSSRAGENTGSRPPPPLPPPRFPNSAV